MGSLINWLVGDWDALVSSPWAHIAITFAALICGAIIGGEREKREKPAGLRTLVLVCLGSTIFTMASFAFGTTTGDTGRVAAQIVTGIGFLGAGVILHGRTAVSGITTAATIWATAAIGIVVGVGYLGAGIGLSLLVRGVLSGMFWWEQRSFGDARPVTVEMRFDLRGGKTRFRIERLLDEFNVRNPLEISDGGTEGLARVRFTFCLPHRQCLELLDELARLPEVHEIRECPNSEVNAGDCSRFRKDP